MPDQAPLCTSCSQHRDANVHLSKYRQNGYHPYVGGSTVFAVDLGGFVLKLDKSIHCEACQETVYTVIYGQDVSPTLSYDKAAQKLGYAIMHGVQAAGLIKGE